MSFFPGSSSGAHRPGASSRPGAHRTTTYTYGAPRASFIRPASAASFFSSGGTARSSSSYYKRRPRDGYIARLIAKIKKLLRDLYRYIKKNPVKVLLPILSLLVSGGALAGLAKGLGISLPEGLRNMVGMGQAADSLKGGYDAWYGSQHGGGGGGGGSPQWLGSALKIAGAFV